MQSSPSFKGEVPAGGRGLCKVVYYTKTLAFLGQPPRLSFRHLNEIHPSLKRRGARVYFFQNEVNLQ